MIPQAAFKRVRGSLTVFFALLLTTVLAILLVLTAGLRRSTTILQIEGAMNTSMSAVFAEYNRELLEQYDILAVDTSYGTAYADVQNTAEHLRWYCNGNFGQEMLLTRDKLGLTATDAEVISVVRLTDGGGCVFKNQAIRYMENWAGITVESQTTEWSEEVERIEFPVDEWWNQARTDLGQAELPQRENEEGVMEEVPLNNPADAVDAIRNLGILNLVVENTDAVSEVNVDLQECVSRRELRSDYSEETVYREFSVMEQLLFHEYLFHKMGSYTDVMEKSRLKYQMEYLLCGKASDYDNLEGTTNKLLGLRMMMNYIYLSGNGVKQAEIQTVARALTAVVLKPELAPLVAKTITFAWCFAESVQDIRLLLDGGSVPLQKNDSSWKTSLENLVEFNRHLQGASGQENGLTYEMYLRILLFLTSDADVVMRAMDLMEMDVRLTAGNGMFMLDGCIVSMEAEVEVEGSDGSYCILRKFSY